MWERYAYAGSSITWTQPAFFSSDHTNNIPLESKSVVREKKREAHREAYAHFLESGQNKFLYSLYLFICLAKIPKEMCFMLRGPGLMAHPPNCEANEQSSCWWVKPIGQVLFFLKLGPMSTDT